MAETRRSSQKPDGRCALSFEKLAKTDGWTEGQLRTCYDLPKKNLKPGTIIVRISPDLLEDPFKGKQPRMNPDDEYNALETRFYNNLSRVVVATEKSTGCRISSATNRTNHVRVQIAGVQTSDVKLHVEKTCVDALVKLGGGGGGTTK